MGKKKTKTSSSETSHSVVTPTNADWVSQGAQTLSDRLTALGQGDPTRFVAPLSDLESRAAGTAAGLGLGRVAGGGLSALPPLNTGGRSVGEADPWLGGVLKSAAPSASAASLLDNLEAYQNPYRRQVTDAAMADFDAQAGRTRAAQDLSLAGEGAFAGSGAALTRSQTEGELARARSSQLSKLLSDMFTSSAGLAGQDADRRQQVSLANAQLAQQDQFQKAQLYAQDQQQRAATDLAWQKAQSDAALEDQRQRAQMAQFQAQVGLDEDANTRANLASQAALGAPLRGVDQAWRQAPLTTLAQQIDLFSGRPSALFHGQATDSKGTGSSTTTESDGTLGNYLGAALQAANLFGPAPWLKLKAI